MVHPQCETEPSGEDHGDGPARGRRLRADVVSPEGKTWRLRGEYREVQPAERLGFTWSWEGEPEHGETLVTVEFRRLGQSNFTEVLLRHEGFSTVDSCKSHQEGWNACLDTLEEKIIGWQ